MTGKIYNGTEHGDAIALHNSKVHTGDLKTSHIAVMAGVRSNLHCHHDGLP